MEYGGIFSLMFLLFGMKMCSGYDPRIIRRCGKLLYQAMRDPLFTKVGEQLMIENENYGTAFVYSEMKIIQKLIQLFYSASDNAKEGIRQYMGLQEKECDELWCAVLKIAVFDASYASKIDYDICLYYQNNKKVHKSMNFCFREEERTPTNFDDQQSVVTLINERFRKFSGKIQSSYLESHLKTDFYLFSGFKVNPIIFKPQIISSIERFTNLDGKKQIVNWVKTEGDFKGEIVSDENCANGINIFHTTAIGRFEMVYLQPVFLKSDDRSTRSQCIHSIFSNLKKHIERAGNIESNFFTTLTVPHMDISTDTDLKPILESNVAELFQTDQLTNLYQTTDTLQELRIFEDFNNMVVDSNAEVANDQGDKTIDSPFVFAFLHRGSKAILKTGAYLRA